MLDYLEHQEFSHELSIDTFLDENIGIEHIFKFFEGQDLAQLIQVSKGFYQYILTNFNENLDNYTIKCIDNFLSKQAAQIHIDMDDFFKINYGFFIKQNVLNVLKNLNENEDGNHLTINTNFNVIIGALKEVLTETITFTSTSNNPDIYHFKLVLHEKLNISLEGFYDTQQQLMKINNLNNTISKCYDLTSQNPQAEAIKNILSFICRSMLLKAKAEHREKIALKIKHNPEIIKQQKRYQKNLDFKNTSMSRLLSFNAFAILWSSITAFVGIMCSLDLKTIMLLCLAPLMVFPIYMSLVKYIEFKYKPLSAEDYIDQNNSAAAFTEATTIHNNQHGFFASSTADIEDQNFDELQEESSDDETTFLLMEGFDKPAYGV